MILTLDAYYHETTHRQISIYHGCIDYTTEFNMFEGSFVCHEYKNTTTDILKQQEEYLHSLNEIRAYNDMKFIIMFIFIMGFMLIKR